MCECDKRIECGLCDECSHDDIKNIDSDVFLDILDRIGRLHAELIIEATRRVEKEIFIYEQAERMISIQSRISAYIYDELKITKEQSKKGNEFMEKIIFDEGR